MKINKKMVAILLGVLLAVIAVIAVFGLSNKGGRELNNPEENVVQGVEEVVSQNIKGDEIQQTEQDTLDDILDDTEEKEIPEEAQEAKEKEPNDKVTEKQEVPKTVETEAKKENTYINSYKAKEVTQNQEVQASTESESKRKETSKDYKKEKTCTLSVSCHKALENVSLLTKEKAKILPSDGIMFKETEVVFYEGESVFNVLKREMKKNKIHMEFVNTPVYKTAYIEGIGNLYEFDCGELSGWLYKVNGEFPSYGCSRYTINENDKIEFVYTCDLGRDVGGYFEGVGGQRDE